MIEIVQTAFINDFDCERANKKNLDNFNLQIILYSF